MPRKRCDRTGLPKGRWCPACIDEDNAPSSYSLRQKCTGVQGKRPRTRPRQLAKAISERLREENDNSFAACAIIDALRDFVHTLQSTYPGRFPTAVETVYNALSMAVSTAASPSLPLWKVGSIFGVGVEHLRRSRARYLRWGDSGDPSDLLRLRQIRFDAHPPEWREWVREVAWRHPEVTRASESSYDSIRNPFTRLDTTAYRIHWLEMRMSEAVEKISALG